MVTLYPAFAKWAAEDNPAKPEPITTTRLLMHNMFQLKTADTQFCLTNLHKTVKQMFGGRTALLNCLAMLLLGMSSCKTLQENPQWHQRQLNRFLKESLAISTSSFGFYVTDPTKSKPIFSFSEKKYFIPASTTKILTLVEALPVLGDTLSGLEYRISEDTVFIRGTGDPCLLHPEMEAYQGVFNWLQQLPSDVAVAAVVGVP
jgi:D-alanyl-D-alanine carboxypeptidase